MCVCGGQSATTILCYLLPVGNSLCLTWFIPFPYKGNPVGLFFHMSIKETSYTVDILIFSTGIIS